MIQQPTSTKTRKTMLTAIIVIVVLAIALVGAILMNKPNSSNSAQQPTSAPLFTVTLSPASQTVVSELDQNVKFNVTITGNPTYPCAVTFETGQFYQSTFQVSYSGYQSVTPYRAPILTSGDSSVFGLYLDQCPPTVYVTVIDSDGNSYNSNSVSVTTK